MGWLGEILSQLFEMLMHFLVGLITGIWQFLADIIEAVYNGFKFVAESSWAWFIRNLEAVWGWLGDVVQDYWDAFVDYVYDLVPHIKDWIIEWAGGFGDWLDDQMKALGLELTIDDMKSSMISLADAYADAAWILPLNQVVAIIVATLLTIAFIRLLRWILSFLWITG